MKSGALLVAAALIAAGAVQAESERGRQEGSAPMPHAAPNAARPDAGNAEAAGAGQTAARPDAAAAAPLILSDAERAIILESVDLQSDSTLALGFLTVGADVPRRIPPANSQPTPQSLLCPFDLPSLA